MVYVKSSFITEHTPWVLFEEVFTEPLPLAVVPTLCRSLPLMMKEVLVGGHILL